jgi:hypothetical protein
MRRFVIVLGGIVAQKEHGGKKSVNLMRGSSFGSTSTELTKSQFQYTATTNVQLAVIPSNNLASVIETDRNNSGAVSTTLSKISDDAMRSQSPSAESMGSVNTQTEMFQRLLMRSNPQSNRNRGDVQKNIKEMVRNLVPSVESQVSSLSPKRHKSGKISAKRRNRGKLMDRRGSLAHANKLLRIMREKALHDSHRDVVDVTIDTLKKKTKQGEEEEVSHSHAHVLKAAHLHIRRTRNASSSGGVRTQTLSTTRNSSSSSSSSSSSRGPSSKSDVVRKKKTTTANEENKKSFIKISSSTITEGKEEEESLESKLSRLLAM